MNSRETILDERTVHARALFDGIAPTYDFPAELLSLGQYGRWRRALVRSLALPAGARVLDVATGTAGIALEVSHRYDCSIIGVDQSPGMLARAHGRTTEAPITLAGASANALPFADDSFDCVLFSYLLRYVTNPLETLHELGRVLRPGGVLASVEFFVPRGRITRAGWRAQALGVMPAVSRLLPGGWPEVGAFLGPNIVTWATDWPVERQGAAWESAGITDVKVRYMTWGTAVLLRGTKCSAI